MGAKNDIVYAVQSGISRYKDAGLDPGHALSRAEDDNQARAAEIYRDYQARLVSLNAVDFDDLIALPARLLDDPVIRTRWRRRLKYLLVDEYQDTSASQYRLLRQLVGDVGAMTAVGDDDQSIYGWRGARAEKSVRPEDRLSQPARGQAGTELPLGRQDSRSGQCRDCLQPARVRKKPCGASTVPATICASSSTTTTATRPKASPAIS